jgi:hypothetical protein
VLEEQPEEPPPQPIVVLENAVDAFSSRREVSGPEVLGARKRRNP